MNNAVNIEDRDKTCCFTGHRPEKLGMEEGNLKKLLRKEIRTAVKDGYTTFISGMAKGVDLIAARVVLEERKKNENIRLICASPYVDFEKGGTKNTIDYALKKGVSIHNII